MNTGRPKGNQKHLDLSARIIIEQHLNNGDSFRSIAIELSKDPSTISKEIRRHSIIRERSADAFAPIPCANNYDSSKPRTNICNVMHMCGDNECRRKCVLCRKFRCSDVCKFYKPRECEKLNKPPYVCNGCSKRTNCMMDKKIYSSKYTQDSYEALRTTSREGINQTPESIQKLDNLLSPLLKKGQSIAHIYASHADEIACSRRTIYSYIDRGVFQARNIDLRRKVVYKQRKRKTTASLKDRSFRKDRSYKEFLEYIAANKSVYVVEMDTVEGAKGTSPCFLTMFFRNCSLMLMFLLEEQTQKEVTRIFDHLTELLGIEYPIIQGGMAWVAEYHLAAGVSEAGGLGLIGAASAPADWVRDQVRKAKELTDKPFGVNIMLMSPYAEDVAKVVAEEGVKVVTTGAGSPEKYMKMWKEAGIKVLPVVPSVALAKRLERAGVDGLIVEGCEAGGHIGEATTMALVPQVVSNVSIPVIAAGGIASGKQMLAAYALGACGVQIGTVLLASKECPIHENYKQAILKAKDTSTTVTGRINGTPVRILKNKMAKAYIQKEKAGANMMELEKYTLGSLKKAVFEGNVDEGSLMAGQVAGMIHEIKPVKQILEEMMSELQETYSNLEI